MPLVVVMMALGLGLVVVLGTIGGIVVDAAEARTAADAAALAGARGGRSAADDLAEANGATIVEWVAMGDDVRVTVRVGRAEATARARRSEVRARRR